MTQRFGGSFAPPLTDARLAEYRAAAARAGGPVGDAMMSLLACCERWWDLPEPAGTPTTAHPSGRGVVVAMDPAHVKALWDLVPWEHELAAVQTLFDGIDPADKALRDAAFHLLWFAREFSLDREPTTADKLGG